MHGATRQAALRAVTIGEPAVLNGQVRLVDYDPMWPQQFASVAAQLRSILGQRAVGIEHVGSTAVPGLLAKPIIDIVLAVADAADEAAYLPDVEKAAYVLRIREPDWHQHRLLKGPGVDVNIHVFAAGCPEVVRMIRFRDRLRSDPDDCARYAAAKRELAARHWRYIQDYADAKAPVIEQINAFG